VGLAGFYSKDAIINATYNAHTGIGSYAFTLLLVAAGMTSFYSWRQFLMTFHGRYRGLDHHHDDHHAPDTDDHAHHHAPKLEEIHESPLVMLVPLGVLALGANEATCLYVLPDIFAEYHRLYPSVQISIYRNFSHKVLQKVEDGSIDVGIVTLPAKSASLKFHPIFRDRVMLMVNPRNPLAKLKTVRMKDIAEQPLIFPRTGYTRQLLDKHFRPYKPQLQITMELTSVGMIKCFVGAGLGVSLISASFARNEVRAGEVKLIPIADVELWRELGIVYRRDRTLPRSSSAFISLVRQRAAENPELDVVPPQRKAVRGSEPTPIA